MKNVIFLILLFNFFATTNAQNNLVLDTDFGTSGIVTPQLSTSNGEFAAMAIQPDGKIITYGRLHSYTFSDYTMSRYNVDGSIDTSFGTNGSFTVFSYSDQIPTKYQLKLLSDGKILTVRMIDVNPHPNIDYMDILVNRYNNDGSLDTTFANAGHYIQDYGDSDYGMAIEIQPDNKILIAGRADLDALVFRLNENGTLDTSFGTNGTFRKRYIPFDGFNYVYNFAFAVKLQSDGKIIMAGHTRSESGTNYDIGLMRLNQNGTLDTTFANNGILICNTNVSDKFVSMELSPDDKISIFFNSNGSTGPLLPANPLARILRLDASGHLDTSFGVNGLLTPQFGSLTVIYFLDSVVDADGKFVCIGMWGNGTKYIARFNFDGTLDTSFDVDGYSILPSSLDHPTLYNSNFYDLCIQSDGKILFGGSRLARYQLMTLANVQFGKNSFSIAPNPFKDRVSVNFNIDTSTYLSADLFDSNGRNIQSLIHEKLFTAGNNTLELPISESLSQGVYFIRISNGATGSALKIIK